MDSLAHSRLCWLPASLLFLIANYPRPSCAQTTLDAASSTTPSSLISIPTMTTTTSMTASGLRLSMTTSFTSSSSLNTTTSTSTSRITEDSAPPLFPPAGYNSGHPDLETQRKENAFNYYFLILAAFGVLIVAFLWWVRKRRKRRKEQMRLSGQNALARDLDGWVNTRRWMHGAWRHNQAAAFVRREEGLNEHGEAPPPYQSTSEVTVAQDGTRASRDAASGLTIPTRALSRDDIEMVRPPEYQETTNRDGASSTRPDTATTRTTRPGTADLHPSSSTRDLLRIGRTQPNG